MRRKTVYVLFGCLMSVRLGGCKIDADAGSGDEDTDTDTGGDTDIDTDMDSDTDPGPCPEVDCNAPRVRYVNQAAGSSGDGLLWETSFEKIQYGVHSAWCAVQECGQPYQVWVAKGTYWIFQRDFDDTLELKDMIELYGGFVGGESSLQERDWVANPTVLSGLSGGEDENYEVRHVITAGDLTRVDGFTITRGDANCGSSYACGFDGAPECARGAGLHKLVGSMVVANCTFTANWAWHQGEFRKEYPEDSNQWILCWRENCGAGGAIYDSGGSLTVENCSFRNNHSVDGGAIYGTGTLNVIDTIFEGNTAYGERDQYDPCDKKTELDRRGGGYSHREFGSGGAIRSEGSVEIRRCSFLNNSATGGGGIVAAEIEVSDSEFIGNRVYGTTWEFEDVYDYGYGGAISGQLTAVNCIFYQNTSKTGGAVFTSNAAIFNSVFYKNSAVSELDPLPDGADPGSCSAIYLFGDPATVSVKNTIFQEGIADDNKEVSDGVDVSYSRIESVDGGLGNIDADALFVDPLNGDFHLQAGSPCIDSADGTAAPELDKDGNPRHDAASTPNTGIGPPWADMGAYEWFE